MKFHWSRENKLFFGTIGVALLALLFTLALSHFRPSQASVQAPATSINNVIVEENAHQGTSSWQIPPGQGALTEIWAYAGATSVSPGQKLTFYISTQAEGTFYSASIYRLGWYGGYGGRLMSVQVNLIGHAQGYFDPLAKRLVNCNSCRVDVQTGLVEANWQPSYTLTVPSDWTTGVYLAKFTDSSGKQTYSVFDVRGNYHSTYIAVTPDTTNEAYNGWGGYSLYGFNTDEAISLGRGAKVSFDRPYLRDYGSGQVLIYEIDAIRWLERQGYDVSYISSVDLHEDPGQLLQHKAYLSLGHDEYWTKEMRDGVQHARDLGVGLGFLGANTDYWQMRFEPDSRGVSDRTVVSYKVGTDTRELAHDPLYGKDNVLVTAQWRDPIINRPENALVGIMYSDFTSKQQGFPWHLSPQAKSPLLDGTGLQPGQQYGCDLVGYEWDHVFNNGATPAGLRVLAISRTMNDSNTPDFSNTAYYIAPSGAMVFATGSIYWTYALDGYRYMPDKNCIGQDSIVPGMQKLMTNVMAALIIHHSQSAQQ